MRANEELCNELGEHILRLRDQLLQPLVGKTEDDIPEETRIAVEDYAQYVGVLWLRTDV